MIVVVMAVCMFMRMFVSVLVSRLVSSIGAAHRIKGCRDFIHCRAKSGQHGFDDMIAQNKDLVGVDRRREMTIADVPGELNEMAMIACRDFVERLFSGSNGDGSAIIKDELISRGQNDGFGKID